jgi:GTPase SAR1 family protein
VPTSPQRIRVNLRNREEKVNIFIAMASFDQHPPSLSTQSSNTVGSNPNINKRKFVLAVVGDGAVGKTCFIERFISGEYRSSYSRKSTVPSSTHLIW